VRHCSSQEAYEAGIDLLKKGAVTPPPYPRSLKKEIISEFNKFACPESMAERLLSISQRLLHHLSALSYLPLFALPGRQSGPFLTTR